ncbi:CE1759 family FMN reductase [Kitasatospora cheerisanensis]|uniref:NADPH-dependent FMN reductase n=1 Tax=Kitasatospora cheerisanensis KCTC 2395 TaxID=1348663 RepID=A0A066YMB2_9ACTN|nr:CE1759 family FMN reductase [Kitasatospora cheerisanensis]KDN82272.1 NADPH-dependent FMN reductase [Kitasatospora cheerisanensis KCTC 2395]
MSALTLAVVSGGLSVPSSTRLLADRLAGSATAALAAAGREATVRLHELRPLATPISNHLVTGWPSPALATALDEVSTADALIAVSPIFSASYSGLFKSFFDLLDPGALAGKPVLIGATGGTARHSLALEHALRPLFAYQRALAAPTAVFAASEDWGGTGDSRTDTLPARIDRAGQELAALVLAAAATAAPGPAGPTAPALGFH